MDELVTILNEACVQLIPIFSAVALFLLIVFIVKMISLIKEVTKRVVQLEPTLRNVDISLEKMQVPLDTCVDLSHSVDKLHETGEKALKSAVDYTATQFANVKKQYDDKKQQKQENEIYEKEII